jgi:cobalt-zinc-cadmium efflux system outer membrane protein
MGIRLVHLVWAILALSLDGSAAPVAAESPPPPAEPAGDLTLASAVELALSRSPRLAALARESEAREAEAEQAGVRPNPELSAELENVLGSGPFSSFGSAEATIALSQAVELGGKRGKRREAGAAGARLAASDHEIERVVLGAETTRRFVGVLSAQERVALAEELVGIFESTLADVSRRVDAGGASPVERSRARVELETSRIDLDQRRRVLLAERQRLAAMWGSSSPQFARAVGDMEALAPPPEWSDVLLLVEESPELRRRQVELELRRATLALERARGVPDLTVGAGARWLEETGDGALLFGLGLPLPVFDRNRAGARAAETRIAQADAERGATAIALEAAVARAYQELAASHSEANALRDEVLPEAERAFTTARDAYRQGLLRLTDVLDTERTLFELRGRRVDALARYHAAVADLEALLGAPLAQATTTEDDR